MKAGCSNRRRSAVLAVSALCAVAALAYAAAFHLVLRAEVARTFDTAPTFAYYSLARPVLWLSAGLFAGAAASPLRFDGPRPRAVAVVLLALFALAWGCVLLGGLAGIVSVIWVEACLGLIPPAGALAGMAGAVALCGDRL